MAVAPSTYIMPNPHWQELHGHTAANATAIESQGTPQSELEGQQLK
jgi:hypothetical protein